MTINMPIEFRGTHTYPIGIPEGLSPKEAFQAAGPESARIQDRIDHDIHFGALHALSGTEYVLLAPSPGKGGVEAMFTGRSTFQVDTEDESPMDIMAAIQTARKKAEEWGEENLSGFLDGWTLQPLAPTLILTESDKIAWPHWAYGYYGTDGCDWRQHETHEGQSSIPVYAEERWPMPAPLFSKAAPGGSAQDGTGRIVLTCTGGTYAAGLPEGATLRGFIRLLEGQYGDMSGRVCVSSGKEACQSCYDVFWNYRNGTPELPGEDLERALEDALYGILDKQIRKATASEDSTGMDWFLTLAAKEG